MSSVNVNVTPEIKNMEDAMHEKLFFILFSVDVDVLRMRNIVRDFLTLCEVNGINPTPIYKYIKTKNKDTGEKLETYQVSFKASNRDVADKLVDSMDQFTKENPRIYRDDIIEFDIKP